jgi:transcriptional regulator with XRE-family HTH domain
MDITPPRHGPDLDEAVLQQLKARKGEWKRIADESKVVSYSWISKFVNNHIPNPGLRTLRELHDWLQAHPALPTHFDGTGGESPSATVSPPA